VTFTPILTSPNSEATPNPSLLPALILPPNIYAITATAGSGGSVSPGGSVFVNYGVSQRFNITADAGYRIVGVSVDGVSQGAISNYTFSNVQTDHNITASFALIPVDHFVVTVPDSATAGSAFIITVTAVDASGNTVSSFNGTVSLSADHGSVNPSMSGSFPAGVWTGLVVLTHTGPITITATNSGHSGTSSVITVGAASTALPSTTMYALITIVVVAAIAAIIAIMLKQRKASHIGASYPR
jgi:hypothetical protein